MHAKKIATLTIAGALALLAFAPAVATAHETHKHWFSYEGQLMTPVIGGTTIINDPTNTMTDGFFNPGGAFVCNYDDPGETEFIGYQCSDFNGDDQSDYIVDKHTSAKAIVLDDVWAEGIRASFCVDGDNDSICVDQPEEAPEDRIDAQTTICDVASATLDYSAQNDRADNNDTYAIGDAVVFLAGAGNQGIIDENNPDPFRCPVLPAPTGATTGGVLGPQGFGNNGISFEFSGTDDLDNSPGPG